MSKRYAPATERNRDPFWACYKPIFPSKAPYWRCPLARVSMLPSLHLGSLPATGYPLMWMRSACHPLRLGERRRRRRIFWHRNAWMCSIPDGWWRTSNCPSRVSAMVNINMVHIAPWPCCEGLFDGAERILPPQAVVLMYGPFKQGGEHTSSLNAAFDQQLKAQDARWGVRDLEAVIEVAKARGFDCQAVIPMPANNLMVSFTRA